MIKHAWRLGRGKGEGEVNQMPIHVGDDDDGHLATSGKKLIGFRLPWFGMPCV